MKDFADNPKIYTSWYKGEQIGQSISISLYPPEWFRGSHEPLFAPTRQILNSFKNRPPEISVVEAITTYTTQFQAEMEERDREIDQWLEEFESRGESVTLNCYEVDDPDFIDNPFCHRHLVAEKIKRKKPHLWGGEVAYIRYKFPSVETPNLGYIEGEEIEYYNPKNEKWVAAFFKEVHTTSFAKPGQFSYLEVLVKGRVHKAFSLNQIRKIGALEPGGK